ncbi:MAG: hypothetical protein ACI8QC_004105 [Planctomycetota bacterium]|jgi:hypothetical protein
MNKRTKILASAFGLLALCAATLGQPAQQVADSMKARLLTERAEVGYYDGHVGIEFQIRNLGETPIGDREVRVVDLDPALPKLLGGVRDDRAPLSGAMEFNGMLIPMELLPGGDLIGTLPRGAFQWFSSNTLKVRVFDGFATSRGTPSGETIVTWQIATGSLL